MKWSAEEARYGTAFRAGQRVPTAVRKAFESKPEEPPVHLHWYMRAFWVLNADRQIGMGGAGRIPFASVEAYARRYGMDDPDEFDRFLAIITHLDTIYLEEMRPKTDDEGNPVVEASDTDAVRQMLRRRAAAAR